MFGGGVEFSSLKTFLDFFSFTLKIWLRMISTIIYLSPNRAEIHGSADLDIFLFLVVSVPGLLSTIQAIVVGNSRINHFSKWSVEVTNDFNNYLFESKKGWNALVGRSGYFLISR